LIYKNPLIYLRDFLIFTLTKCLKNGNYIKADINYLYYIILTINVKKNNNFFVFIDKLY